LRWLEHQWRWPSGRRTDTNELRLYSSSPFVATHLIPWLSQLHGISFSCRKTYDKRSSSRGQSKPHMLGLSFRCEDQLIFRRLLTSSAQVSAFHSVMKLIQFVFKFCHLCLCDFSVIPAHTRLPSKSALFRASSSLLGSCLRKRPSRGQIPKGNVFHSVAVFA